MEIVRVRLNHMTAEHLRNFEALCHIAATMKGPPAALFADNVVATRRLLKTAQAAEVPRVVLLSSLAVYGTSRLQSGSTLDETCPLDDQPHLRDPYTYSKLAAELVAWEAHRAGRCPLVVVRPGVIYGPGRDPLTTRVGLRHGNLLLQMGSRHLLPYVHVDACAAGVALAITTPGIAGQAFNLLDDDLMTSGEFVRQYRRSHPRLRVIRVPQWAIGTVSRLSAWYHRWSRGQLPAVLTPYRSAATWKRLRYSTAKSAQFLGWKQCRRTQDGIGTALET
jgi:nucleoside-diphosphate-sugar epimerase